MSREIFSPSLENYTLRQLSTIMGYEQDITVKFTSDKIEVSMLLDGKTEPTVIEKFTNFTGRAELALFLFAALDFV